MKKIMMTVLCTILGICFLSVQSTSANTKSDTVISTGKLIKAPYHAVSGYIYQSISLTHKQHNADHYPLTTFYATRSANIIRPNGNKAVYNYIKNGNNHIHGWIWRGYLVRVINVQKQKAAINKLISLIDALTPFSHDKVTLLLKNVGRKESLNTLLSTLSNLSGSITDTSDIQKIETMYKLLKSDDQTLAAIFQNGLKKFYTGVIALHQFNNQVFKLAEGLLALIPD
uniref:D-alanyl-D-alanine carboxypeptidase n=1 Tax=Lentilactobacillus hilgardii TaxID=1588 RepID=UPI00403FBECC